MLHTPPAGTRFYRVTDRGRSWGDVLSGAGAYFSFGGRYNRVHQRTIYAAEDPLVSIAEHAFHQAVDWQGLIAGSRADPSPHPLCPLRPLGNRGRPRQSPQPLGPPSPRIPGSIQSR